MPEKSFGPAADRPQPVTVAHEAKRRGVMHHANDRMLPQPRPGLAQVATEHPRHRDLRIGQEPIQRLAVSDRCHLFREAIARLARCQRHDAVQSLVEPGISHRVALEFPGHVTHRRFPGLGHAPSDHRRSPNAIEMCWIMSRSASELIRSCGADLDHVLFWHACDLERTLADFQAYLHSTTSHHAIGAGRREARGGRWRTSVS